MLKGSFSAIRQNLPRMRTVQKPSVQALPASLCTEKAPLPGLVAATRRAPNRQDDKAAGQELRDQYVTKQQTVLAHARASACREFPGA